MCVFVMPLTWLCVVSPRLRGLKIYLVLGVVDSRKVIRNRSLDKVPQLGQFLVPQDRIVYRGRVAHVRASLLAFDKRQFFCGQITV